MATTGPSGTGCYLFQIKLKLLHLPEFETRDLVCLQAIWCRTNRTKWGALPHCWPNMQVAVSIGHLRSPPASWNKATLVTVIEWYRCIATAGKWYLRLVINPRWFWIWGDCQGRNMASPAARDMRHEIIFNCFWAGLPEGETQWWQRELCGVFLSRPTWRWDAMVTEGIVWSVFEQTYLKVRRNGDRGNCVECFW